MGAAAFVLNETGIRGIRLDDAAEVSDGIAAALAHNGPGVVVLVCGAILIVLASRLRRSKETGRPSSSPSARVFHFLPVRAVRGALSEQQRQSMVTRGVRPRISDCRRTATGRIPRALGSGRAMSHQR